MTQRSWDLELPLPLLVYKVMTVGGVMPMIVGGVKLGLACTSEYTNGISMLDDIHLELALYSLVLIDHTSFICS